MDPDTGDVTVPQGGKVEITDSEGNKSVVTGPAVIHPDGPVEVQEGGSVDDPTTTVTPDHVGPGTYDPGTGAWTPEGGTPANPQKPSVEPDPTDPENNPPVIVVPGEDGDKGEDGDNVIIKPDEPTDPGNVPTIDPDTGDVNVPGSGEVVIPGKTDNPGGNITVTVEGDFTVTSPKGDIVLPENSMAEFVDPNTGKTVVVTGPATIHPDGGVNVNKGGKIDTDKADTDPNTEYTGPGLYADGTWTGVGQDPDSGEVVIPGTDPGTDDNVVVKPDPEDPNKKPSIDPGTGDVKVPEGGEIILPGTDPGTDDDITVKPTTPGVTVDPDTGDVTVPQGGKVEITDSEGNKTVVTGPAVIHPDGPIEVGETGKIDINGDGNDDYTTPGTWDPNNKTWTPEGTEIIVKPVDPANPGQVIIPGGDKEEGGGDDVVIKPDPADPNKKPSIDPNTGDVKVPEGGEIILPGTDPAVDDDITVKPTTPGVTVDPDTGDVTVPQGGKVEVTDGDDNTTVITGPAVIHPDGPAEIGAGGKVEVTDGDGNTTVITGPAAANPDGTIEVPSGGKIEVSDGQGGTSEITGRPAIVEGGKVYIITGNFQVEAILDQGYTGSPITPQPVVRDKDSGAPLTANQQYTLSYQNNTAPGTATVTVTGIGGYQGSTGAVTFNIVGGYTITFDANGGTLSGSASMQTDLTGKLTGTLPTATRDGHTFDGWYYGGQKVEENTVFTGNTIVYAKWTGTGGSGSTGGGGSTGGSGSTGGGNSSTETTTAPDGSKIETTTRPDGSKVVVTTKPDGTVTVQIIDKDGNIINIDAFSCDRGAHCPISSFTDADPNAWYHDGVHYCVENGLMIGVGENKFVPNGAVSRAQIVTILWRLEGKPVVNYAMSFDDVADGAWYTEAVRWAQANGIVTGYNDTVFGPNDSITREQMASILYRYAQYRGLSMDRTGDLTRFTDLDQVSGYAAEAMTWAYSQGLVDGITTTTLVPRGNANRAQAATIIARFCRAFSTTLGL